MRRVEVGGHLRLALVAISMLAALGCSGSSDGDGGGTGQPGTGGEGQSGTGGTGQSGTGGTGQSGTGGTGQPGTGGTGQPGTGGSSGTDSGGSAGEGGDSGTSGMSGAGTSGGASSPGTVGSWTTFESPFTGIDPDAAVVKLEDGSVFIVAGGSYRFMPDDNTFVSLSSAPDRRSSVAAALLDDGRVLVAGGRSSGAPDGLRTAYLYDPDQDSWTPTSDLPAERRQQAALTLPNGDVLVVGGVGPGVGGTPVAEVYRYDVADGQWESLPPLTQAVRFPELFQLTPETILVMAENPQVYDLVAESVTLSPPLVMNRRYAEAVQLSGGSVLALGGESLGGEASPLATVDEYVPGASNWAARAPLAGPRSRVGAVALSDGTVFVAGGVGTSSTNPDPAADAAERYVAATNTWYAETPPPMATGTPAVLLDDGSVLFLNGLRFHPQPWQ